MGSAICRIDGTPHGPFDTGALTGINGLLFGAIFSGEYNDHDLDDLRVGTSGYGSGEIFSDDFSGATIVPPFDSQTGAGLSIVGGVLHVFDPAGNDAYAEKDFAVQTTLYVQYKVRISAAEMANNTNFIADLCDLNDPVLGPDSVIFYYSIQFNSWNFLTPNQGGSLGVSASADTWYTIDYFISLPPPPRLPEVHFNDTSHFVTLDDPA